MRLICQRFRRIRLRDLWSREGFVPAPLWSLLYNIFSNWDLLAHLIACLPWMNDSYPRKTSAEASFLLHPCNTVGGVRKVVNNNCRNTGVFPYVLSCRAVVSSLFQDALRDAVISVTCSQLRGTGGTGGPLRLVVV
jgi:hypothetical protein